ncbi:uncharacterized protein LOC114310981 isoform X1 [Camellia sinensis]|uniref:uncharacterized protein LOC114310981 isoform X1 n=1 Tax=Camellia sinensis TaxID=4442 RepID=UPI0010360DF7|nr:uncharacterized protein LOC114310981 isoform X1 [Camellia sinensis]
MTSIMHIRRTGTMQCVRDAILAGRWVGTTITKTGYNEIALKFAKHTGRRHEITRLKNEYNNLKREWQAWNKLMDSSKGVTGIGFDWEIGLFTTLEEWWENLKSTNKIAYKFKTKPLEHEEFMHEVFAGATATGKHHWTPGGRLLMLAKANPTQWTLLGWYHLPSHIDRLFTHLQTPPPSTLKKQTLGQRGKIEVTLVESRKRSLVEHQCLRIVLIICLRRFKHRST